MKKNHKILPESKIASTYAYPFWRCNGVEFESSTKIKFYRRKFKMKNSRDIRLKIILIFVLKVFCDAQTNIENNIFDFDVKILILKLISSKTALILNY